MLTLPDGGGGQTFTDSVWGTLKVNGIGESWIVRDRVSSRVSTKNFLTLTYMILVLCKTEYKTGGVKRLLL